MNEKEIEIIKGAIEKFENEKMILTCCIQNLETQLTINEIKRIGGK